MFAPLPLIVPLDVVAPSLPYGYLLEILFAAILAFSLALALKYPSFGKRWIFLLFVVGIVEYAFSTNPPAPYNILVFGTLIGLVTAFSGLIISVFYLAKPHLHEKRVKVFFILSGCLELILGLVFFLYPLWNFFGTAQIAWFVVFGLLTLGCYSLIVGIASLFFAKPKKQ
jgi:hypothetical protein